MGGPLPDGPSDPMGGRRVAGRGRRPGPRRERRAALLRVRHRRRHAGRASVRIGWRAPGTRTPACTSSRRPPPSPRRSPAAGSSSCSVCPTETSVGFVTGATMANFTALAAARHARPRAGRLGRRAAGAPGRAAGDGHHARRHARDRLRVAPDAGAGSRGRPGPQDRGGRPGPDATRRPPGRAGDGRRPGHRVRPGRQRAHRGVRPARPARSPSRTITARGSTSTGRSGSGRRSSRRCGA